MYRIFKQGKVVALKAPKPITLENSPYRHHFEFEANCVVSKSESRAQFLKTVAAMIEEYQPATFSESLLIAMMASNQWRQLRYARMSAALATTDWTERTRLLELVARWEGRAARSYNANRKFLLQLLSARVNRVGGPSPAPKPPLAA